jgi:hypothetical protein
MHLESILNCVERHKCFAYTRIRFVDGLAEPEMEVAVERVPWGDGKEHLTTSYRWFLARWAKRLSWKETADAFNTTWDNQAGRQGTGRRRLETDAHRPRSGSAG